MRLVYIALAWCAGIVLAADLPTRQPSLWIAPTLIAFFALVFLYKRHHLRIPLLAALAFALGGLRLAVLPETSPLAAYNNRGGLTVEGVVSAPPTIRDTRIELRLNALTVTRAGQTHTIEGAVLVYAPRLTDAQIGDQVLATGDLLTPPELDTFSYADYLARGGIYSLMRESSVEILARSARTEPLTVLTQLRAQARESIASALPEPAAGLLMGILLGDESSISSALDDDFAATGAAHIVAISGFNMVVLSGIVIGVLSRLRLPRARAAIIALIVIGVYTIFVGASAAVTRAALMSGLLIVGGAIRRKTFVPASLAFAALILSAFNPLTLWDVGFQLSLAAVLGIALFADPLGRRFHRILKRMFPSGMAKRLNGLLNEPLIVSIAAMITTLPIIALYFGRLSIVSLLVNVLIVPVQPLVLGIGGAAVIMGLIAPFAAFPLFALVLVLLGWTIAVVRTFAALPLAEVEISVHPTITAGFFIVLVIAAMLRATQPTWAIRVGGWIKSRPVISAALLILVALSVLGVATLRSLPDGRLHVWFLDMGHSHAVLAQTPDGAHLLIDGGRFPSRLLTALGDQLPFYKRTLEIVILTQPDVNEIAALIDVAHRYEIGTVLTNGQPNAGAEYQTLMSTFAARGDPVNIVARGDTFDLPDGTRIEILHPDPLDMPTLTDLFDPGALVVRLHYGDVSFLFTGDVNADGQTVMVESGISLSASVMGLPKHGTENGLEAAFLAAVAPRIIVAQIDPANRYGDPAPDTLDLIADFSLYRTDEGGMIEVSTDGRELLITQADG